MTSQTSPQNYRALLLDIEGTTTPISFVFDVLFPYAATHLPTFLTAHHTHTDVQADVRLLADQARLDVDAQIPGAAHIPDAPPQARLDAAIKNCQWLMANDRKVTGLKSLQGKIWREGYTSGQLKGDLFDDVPSALRRWNTQGLPVHIYSSGSVEAQKLLFARSIVGDLTPLLSQHFDTTTGHKREAGSYTKIAAALDLPPASILFLTDVVPEATAAAAAGLQAALMDRPGNHPQPDHGFPILTDFNDL